MKYFQGDCLPLNFQRIDYRLLVVLMHYHRLFRQKEQAYHRHRHLWIIKPIASSRGAGITLHPC